MGSDMSSTLKVYLIICSVMIVLATVWIPHWLIPVIMVPSFFVSWFAAQGIDWLVENI